MIETIIDARLRRIAGFEVRRLLPYRARRLVGPFIYFDHIGPAELTPGEGLDVGPHPHIGLATVTYLFEGELLHRDSLGSRRAIEPGAINWMTAGRGVAHSERTPPELRGGGARVHAIQLWVALPREHEETAPAFHHHPAHTIPALEVGGATVRVLAGSAFGATSPVEVFSPLVYADVALPAGVEIALPPEHEERALYVVSGAIACGAERVEPGRMVVLTPGATARVRAVLDTRLVWIGGARLEGERVIWWNFVATRQALIDRAKREWKEGRYPTVLGDEGPRVPLPEGLG